MAGKLASTPSSQKGGSMAKNVGGADRIVRAVIGIALIGYAMSNLPGAETWMVPAGIVGFIVLLTAIFGFCPAYLPFGIRTCKLKSK
jgi:hypothetical protein